MLEINNFCLIDLYGQLKNFRHPSTYLLIPVYNTGEGNSGAWTFTSKQQKWK